MSSTPQRISTLISAAQSAAVNSTPAPSPQQAASAQDARATREEYPKIVVLYGNNYDQKIEVAVDDTSRVTLQDFVRACEYEAGTNGGRYCGRFGLLILSKAFCVRLPIQM